MHSLHIFLEGVSAEIPTWCLPNKVESVTSWAKLFCLCFSDGWCDWWVKLHRSHFFHYRGLRLHGSQLPSPFQEFKASSLIYSSNSIMFVLEIEASGVLRCFLQELEHCPWLGDPSLSFAGILIKARGWLIDKQTHTTSETDSTVSIGFLSAAVRNTRKMQQIGKCISQCAILSLVSGGGGVVLQLSNIIVLVMGDQLRENGVRGRRFDDVLCVSRIRVFATSMVLNTL
jgi:hypothetical protein